jgi:hypothetical protein
VNQSTPPSSSGRPETGSTVSACPARPEGAVAGASAVSAVPFQVHVVLVIVVAFQPPNAITWFVAASNATRVPPKEIGVVDARWIHSPP